MSLVSKRSSYALHGLAYISVSPSDEPVPLNRILDYLKAYSHRLSLSPSYIAKIFQDLSRVGLVQAVPGPRGGYLLARPPRQIKLVDVVTALDGPLMTGCCLLSVGECDRQSTCGVAGMIHEAEAAFQKFFEKETVATLARRMSFPEELPLTISPRKPGTASRRGR
jgi:Rrf2 family protein